jgi:antitoxin component YwqK of YwqJK toxin-antitoxin module
LLYYLPEGKTKAKIYYENGNLAAEGIYLKQKKDSLWKYYSEDSTLLLYEEFYKNCLKNGISRKYYPNKNIAEETQWKDDIKDGIWKQYFEDGQLKLSSTYINGQRTGEFITYNPNGRISIKGKYINDIKEGKWIYYKDDGSIEYEVEYKNGVASNQDEINKKAYENLKEIEKNKGKFKDPDDYRTNPEDFLK